MPTLTYLESLEHGIVSTAGGGIWRNKTGDPTIQAGIGPNGEDALRATWVAQSGQEKFVEEWGDQGSTVRVVSYYARLTSRTAGNVIRPCQILTFDGTTNHFHGPIFNPSTGRLEFWSGPSAVDSGIVYTLNQWYRLDWRVVCTGSTDVTIDWQVDGVAQGSLSYAPGGSARTVNVTQWCGCADGSVAITAVIDVCSLWASATSGDYPLGPHENEARTPSAPATHSLDASPSLHFFKDVGGVETALTTGETTSHSVLNEAPFDAADHLLIKSVAGAKTFADPNGAGTAVAWTGTVTNIDDAVRQPTAPSDGLTISSSTDEQSETVTMSDPTFVAGATYTLWVYGTGGTKRAVDVAYSYNGSDPGTAHATRAQLIGANGAAGWYSRVLIAPANQTELNNMRVQFICDATAGGGGASACSVNACYLEISSPDVNPAGTEYAAYALADI